MAFNGRASLLFPMSTSKPKPHATAASAKPELDAVMKLPDSEIVGCISDLGIPFTMEDLTKPQPATIQRVYELFAEIMMNVSRDTVEPSMREAARDIMGEEMMDLMPIETRNLMGFYTNLKRLMIESQVQEFSFTDLLRPTYPRVSRQFSYVINFLRFRESQVETIDQHYNKAEKMKSRTETLYLENQDLEARLEMMRNEKKTMQAQMSEKVRHNEELKSRLLDLKRQQERTAVDMEQAKSTKQMMTTTLQERTERLLRLRQESEKLRPYAQQSITALQVQLEELSDSLSRDKVQLDSQEKRARALQTSADTFSLAANDVQPIVGLLTSLSSDIAAEEAELLSAAQTKDALAERSNSVRDVEHTESLLETQLKRWLERTEILRKTAATRAEEASSKMNALKHENEELTREGARKKIEVEKRKTRCAKLEEKMESMKMNIEREVESSREEFFKLEAHVGLYLREMEGTVLVGA